MFVWWFFENFLVYILLTCDDFLFILLVCDDFYENFYEKVIFNMKRGFCVCLGMGKTCQFCRYAFFTLF